MTLFREIKFFDINGKEIINSIIFDDDFRNKLNQLLEIYKSSNEDYIKLICNNIVLNTKNIFNVDDDFNLDNITDNVQVIKCYKKYVYCQEEINKFKVNDKYDDEYSILLKNLIRIKNYNYIINNSYYNIVLNSVKKDGTTLKYTSEDIKNNYDIVLAAVKQNGRALQYASKDMKNNYDIILNAVKQNGYALQYAEENMKNNFNIVLNAVNTHGCALQYASDNMRNNYDIVLDAVKQNSHALQYASDDMRNNYDIVLAVVE